MKTDDGDPAGDGDNPLRRTGSGGDGGSIRHAKKTSSVKIPGCGNSGGSTSSSVQNETNLVGFKSPDFCSGGGASRSDVNSSGPRRPKRIQNEKKTVGIETSGLEDLIGWGTSGSDVNGGRPQHPKRTQNKKKPIGVETPGLDSRGGTSSGDASGGPGHPKCIQNWKKLIGIKTSGQDGRGGTSNGGGGRQCPKRIPLKKRFRCRGDGAAAAARAAPPNVAERKTGVRRAGSEDSADGAESGGDTSDTESINSESDDDGDDDEEGGMAEPEERCFECQGVGALLQCGHLGGCGRSYHAECVGVDINTCPLSWRCPRCLPAETEAEAEMRLAVSEPSAKDGMTPRDSLECRVEAQARTIADLKRAVENGAKLNSELQSTIAKMGEDTKKDVLSIAVLNERCRSMRASERRQQQLHDELSDAHRSLGGRCRGLEEELAQLRKSSREDIKLRNDEIESSKEAATQSEESVKTLREKNRSLEEQLITSRAGNHALSKMYEAKKAAFDTLTGQLVASRAECDKLRAKHSTLGGEFKNLVKQKNIAVESLANDIQSANSRINGLEKAKESLKESNEAKEKQIRVLKEGLEDSVRLRTEQLASSKATSDELLAKNETLQLREVEVRSLYSKVQTAEGLINGLQTANASLEESTELKDKQIEDLANDVQKSNGRNGTLQKEMQCLKESTKTKEKRIEELEESVRRHNKHLVASKAAYDELQAKHSALGDEFKKIQNAMKLRNDEVQSLKNHVQVANGSIGDLQRVNGSLEKSKETKQKKIEELEESAQMHMERLDASKEAHNTLLAKHSALEGEFKDLEIIVKQRGDEVQSLENDVRAAKGRVTSLQRENESLIWSGRKKEKQIEELEESARRHGEQLDSTKAAYNELHLKHSSLEGNCKNLVSSNAVLRRQIDEKRRTIESLQAEVKTLEHNATAMNKHREEAQRQIKELTGNAESQMKTNDHLKRHLKECLECLKSIQAGNELVHEKIQQTQAGSSSATDIVGPRVKSDIAKTERDIVEPFSLLDRGNSAVDSDGDCLARLAAITAAKRSSLLPFITSSSFVAVLTGSNADGNDKNLSAGDETKDSEMSTQMKRVNAENDESSVHVTGFASPAIDYDTAHASMMDVGPPAHQHANAASACIDSKKLNAGKSSSNDLSGDCNIHTPNGRDNQNYVFSYLLSTEVEMQSEHFDTKKSPEKDCNKRSGHIMRKRRLSDMKQRSEPTADAKESKRMRKEAEARSTNVERVNVGAARFKRKRFLRSAASGTPANELKYWQIL